MRMYVHIIHNTYLHLHIYVYIYTYIFIMPGKNDSFEWDLFLKFTKACVSKTIVYPLDLIKTRKQVVRYPFTASNGKTYSGTILGIAQQLADEGFVNMIALIPQCFRVIPKQMINAALKDPVKSFFKVEKDY